MYKIYLQKGDLNEATSFYINIITKGLIECGEEVANVYSIKQIQSTDKVVTIQAKAFFRVWLTNPMRKIINWYQGIVPEEAMCEFEHSFSKYLRKFFWRFLEFFSLHKAVLNIFVSESMLKHYQKQYGYNKLNYFIMPCFNQKLNLGCFNEDKYQTSTFVYAGSLSRWQCIDETLLIFKEIKNVLPDASLTLLTKEINKASMLCRKYNISAKIEYVPSDKLQQVLSKYKYGFIIRDDIAVNNVATPTKMNSYMAAGVIPIYSDVIGDFQNVFHGLKYVVPLKGKDNVIAKILEIEREGVDCGVIKMEYTKVFRTYYSEDKYIKSLKKVLDNC